MPQRILLKSCSMVKLMALQRYRNFKLWLSMALMLCLLGQAILPSMASMDKRASRPLWDQICRVYGSSPAAGSADPSVPLHAHCTLCLHLHADLILTQALPALQMHWLLQQCLRFTLPDSVPVWQDTGAVRVRGPPLF